MAKAFDGFLASYAEDVQRLARKVRALLFEVAPEVSEHVYPAMKVIRYGLDGNKMAGLVYFLMPTKAGVSLGFHHGTRLPDKKGLLEGAGKNLRHVKLKRLEEVDDPALRALLEAELREARRKR
jgi:hypothetical protein